MAGAVLGFLETRYGLGPEALGGHTLWHRPGTPALWIAARDVEPPTGRCTEGIGLCAFRDPPPKGKPTTVFLLRFGHLATRGVVEVDAASAEAFGPDVELPLADATLRGWVIVRHDGRVLGRGWASDGRLKCEQKRSWRGG